MLCFRRIGRKNTDVVKKLLSLPHFPVIRGCVAGVFRCKSLRRFLVGIRFGCLAFKRMPDLHLFFEWINLIMKNLHSLIIMSLSAVALGGCAVSSGALSSGRDASTAKAIEARALPVSSMAGASEGALVANSGKFAKSKDQSLTLADANKSFEEIDAEFQQAYAVASNQFVPISTEHAAPA